jgi:ATP-binding cassette, subfamily B (MDR/TAP), member 1
MDKVDNDPPPQLPPVRTSTAMILTSREHHPPTRLCGIIPSHCDGEFSLHNATFVHPTMPVLSNISIYIPAHETTITVGSSGSGKSSLAQLLRMYTPQSGCIQIDDQDLAYLDLHGRTSTLLALRRPVYFST